MAQQTYKLDKEIRAFLRKVKRGQSLNLAVWATKVLEARKMTFKDLEKMYNLGFDQVEFSNDTQYANY